VTNSTTATGDTTFHSLYRAHAGDVFRFARYLTGSDDAAADITSETFLRAWVGRDAIRVETAKAYLLTIARNLYRDDLRRTRQVRGLGEVDHVERRRSANEGPGNQP